MRNVVKMPQPQISPAWPGESRTFSMGCRPSLWNTFGWITWASRKELELFSIVSENLTLSGQERAVGA